MVFFEEKSNAVLSFTKRKDLKWNWALSSHAPSHFMKQFVFLQKLYMKNYENYSYIKLGTFPCKNRLFVIFLL